MKISLASTVTKLSTFFADKSLRWKIMLSFSLALILMITILVATLRLEFNGVNTLGETYKSNSELSYFSQELNLMEKAMENYVNYHTFESIDSFFSHKSKANDFMEQMQQNPSINELRQKEYIAYQLGTSFLHYSEKAITARRANAQEEINYYYPMAIKCFNLLTSNLLELNQLLLSQNAKAYEENTMRIVFMNTFTIIFFLIFAFLIYMVLYLLISSITNPLREISKIAIRVSKRNFDVPLFNKKTHDEIGNICQAFDRMIISIREYIDTIWEKARTEAELKEKEIEMQALYTDAQLQALQNQINPHFLFNTLNTGAQLAMMEGADKTCYFIEQVSDFFRYNIQQQTETASIEEELGLIDNFVYIMKVRFGDRLEFSKEIPEQKIQLFIPRMTLQPLVENCIKHGLKNQIGKVGLKIEIFENFIQISISDNGSGFPKEIKDGVFQAVKTGKTKLDKELLKAAELSNRKLSVEAVERERDGHNGTGLINVFLRLKLFFHRDDIFDITSNENGEGTKFIIRVPYHV